MKFKATLITAALCLSYCPPAVAGPTSATGVISSYFLSGATNYAFRISLNQSGVNPLSQCTDGFAYLNTSDNNYQAKVSSLLSAYAMKSTVSLAGIATDSGGFCVIQDFMVTN